MTGAAASVEHWVLYGQIAFSVIDEFTGGAPIGWLRYSLDVKTDTGFRSSGLRPVFTTSGLVAYPKLGRVADTRGKMPIDYRFRVDAEFYRPIYRSEFAGIEIAAHPYSHTVVPPVTKPLPTPTPVNLLPAANYPYPTHVPVVRGFVITKANMKPVADALVSVPVRKELTLTDERGAFALPLRRTKIGDKESLIAEDLRTKAQGNRDVTIPADLGKTITIQIV